MSQTRVSKIIFSSLACGCLISLLGADESFHRPYPNAPDRRARRAETKPPMETKVQANRLNVRQMERGGIGYGQGYTTLEAFLTPFTTFNSWLPFFDLRVHHFDNSKYAFNAGFGFRYFTPSNCTLWGFNAYYDYRQTHHKNYKQVGIGLEALGAHWDYRINGYIPVGSRKSHLYHLKFDKFAGHQLYVKAKREFDLGGVNAEVAYHWMPTKNIDITAALGPYYFRGEYNKFAAGGQGRVKATFLNAIAIEGIGSYDNLFKWNGQGQLTFSIPLGPRLKTRGVGKSTCNDRYGLNLRVTQPVQRFEIIVADSHHESKVAINPLTGQPFNFVFVNNDPSSTPNGTYENPYVTMDQAQAGSAPSDIVYVYGGGPIYTVPNRIGHAVPPPIPASSVDGFVMQNNQKLWGSGISHLLQTSLGKVNIPAKTTAYPALNSETPGDTAYIIVTLANNNEVSGLSFPDVNVGFGAIYGNEITNTVIKNNIMNLNGDVIDGTYGISLRNSGGTLMITNNRITSIDAAQPDEGIALLNTLPLLCTAYISNNTIIGNGVTGNFGIRILNSNGSYFFQNNSISTCDEGILCLPTLPDISASVQISGNMIVNCKTYAIIVQPTGGSENVAITNNTFMNNNHSTGIVTLGTKADATLSVQFNNNLFQGNGSVSGTYDLLVETLAPPSSICMQVNNNIFDRHVSFVGHPPTGPISLEPPIGNTNLFIQTAGVTGVAPGTCE